MKEYSENMLREKLSSVDFEANMPPKKECPECDGSGGHWGLAPHAHLVKDGKVVVGGTIFNDRKTWPKNFVELEPGEGIYKCEKCNGEGWVYK